LFGTTYTIAPGSNRMTGIGSLGIGYAIDTAGKRTRLCFLLPRQRLRAGQPCPLGNASC